jgi:hypothetical protein
MKKKQIKTLSLNKLKISKINFSERIKGGSEVLVCRTSYEPTCTKATDCQYGSMGS